MDSATILDRLGGTTATARMLALSPTVVSSWRRKGIPAAYWRDILDAFPASARDSIADALLSDAASRRRAAVRSENAA